MVPRAGPPSASSARATTSWYQAGARRQLAASLEAWPRDPLALLTLARAEQALGNDEAARRALAAARAGWNGDVEAVPLTRV